MFELGKLIVTDKIATAMKADDFTREINAAFAKYNNREWGDVKEPYKNDLALINEDNEVLGKYTTSKGTIYIRTVCDRTMTTIGFVDEC